MKKIAAILSLTVLVGSPLKSFAAESIEEFKPQSAAELGRSVGLEFLSPLTIGDSASVKAGKIPLAGTLPVTYGELVRPSNLPPAPPPAQRKVLPQEDFDAFFFHQIDQYPYKTIIFEKIFEQGDSDRYKYLASELRLVYQTPPPAKEEIQGRQRETKKEVRPVKPSQPRRQERPNNSNRQQNNQRGQGKLW